EKYHSNGLWSNTSCSHPLPGEPVIEAAQRRLLEEMGLQTDLEEAFWFIYREKLDNNLTEYELDHVFIGFTDEHPKINPNEVTNWKYITSDDLKMDINKNPEKYTAWFKIIVERVSREYKRNKKVRKTESKTIEL
ncbi:MAG TPA: NUDIX domain-containing protein, partial [Prolixibacteraceae bacterium]|nr:NUDIX domain-containing protein [Prolixibacteraceae bacterium]